MNAYRRLPSQLEGVIFVRVIFCVALWELQTHQIGSTFPPLDACGACPLDNDYSHALQC